MLEQPNNRLSVHTGYYRYDHQQHCYTTGPATVYLYFDGFHCPCHIAKGDDEVSARKLASKTLRKLLKENEAAIKQIEKERVEAEVKRMTDEEMAKKCKPHIELLKECGYKVTKE